MNLLNLSPQTIIKADFMLVYQNFNFLLDTYFDSESSMIKNFYSQIFILISMSHSLTELKNIIQKVFLLL